MIITIAQQKGGAGKTTLAAQLAVAFLGMRKTVATVDCDPQASLTRWQEVRQDRLGADSSVAHVQATGWRIGREIENLAKQFDYVIVDSPPHAEADSKAAIKAADFVLVPVQPSPMDVWATQPILQLAVSERVPVLLVANRVPARSNMAEGIVENLDSLGADVAKVRLGQRIAYAESMLEGRGVMESHRLSSAADEVSALAREVVRRSASIKSKTKERVS
jgi:chromosome partitioning protein